MKKTKAKYATQRKISKTKKEEKLKKRNVHYKQTSLTKKRHNLG